MSRVLLVSLALVGCTLLRPLDRYTSGFDAGSGDAGEVELPCDDSVELCARALSAGDRHACAITPANEIVCWGDNGEAQLGRAVGQPMRSTRPLRVPNLLAASRVLGAGDSFTCADVAVDGGGELRCWGNRDQGRFGDAMRLRAQETPVPVPFDGGVARLIMKSRFGCVLSVAGELWCWGDQEYGQLGPPAADVVIPPTHLQAYPAPVKDVALAPTFACTVSDRGRVFCAGSGWLGDGQFVERRTAPVEVIDVASGTATVSEVCAGGAFFACARRSTGQVWCWGKERFGEGNGQPPTVVLEGAESISCGTHQLCARFGDGGVGCLGLDDRGQLGRGTSSDAGVFVVSPPQRIEGLGEVRQLAHGDEFSCALARSGRVACWGANDVGQLGNGTTADQSSPTHVLAPL